jgi:hypothetical protein
MYNKTDIQNAKEIFQYLSLSDTIEKADVIIGFGHFDIKIPTQCADLFLKGYGKKIIFTGGVGAGSADLKKPEAEVFKDTVKAHFSIPSENIILETKSTNTGENILFTKKILDEKYPELKIKKAIIVANSYRQRRVFLTCKKNLPDVSFINVPPYSSFEDELEMYRLKGQDLIEYLTGEIERLEKYSSLGYIQSVRIPTEIKVDYKYLKNKFQTIKIK